MRFTQPSESVKLRSIIEKAKEANKRILKSRTLNKAVNRLDSEEKDRHDEFYSELSKVNSEIFVEWPLERHEKVPEDLVTSVQLIRGTLKKIGDIHNLKKKS